MGAMHAWTPGSEGSSHRAGRLRRATGHRNKRSASDRDQGRAETKRRYCRALTLGGSWGRGRAPRSVKRLLRYCWPHPFAGPMAFQEWPPSAGGLTYTAVAASPVQTRTARSASRWRRVVDCRVGGLTVVRCYPNRLRLVLRAALRSDIKRRRAGTSSLKWGSGPSALPDAASRPYGVLGTSRRATTGCRRRNAPLQVRARRDEPRINTCAGRR